MGKDLRTGEIAEARSKIQRQILAEGKKQTGELSRSLTMARKNAEFSRMQLFAAKQLNQTLKSSISSDERNVALQRARGAVGVGQDFLTEQAKINYEFLLQQNEINSKAVDESYKAQVKSSNELRDSILKTLEGAQKARIGRGSEETTDTAMGRQVSEYMDDIVRQTSRFDMSDINTDFSKFDSILKTVVQSFDSLNEKTKQSIQQSIAENELKRQNSLAETERQRRHEQAVNELNKEISEQKMIYSELKGAFGGIQSFIAGGEDSPENRNRDFLNSVRNIREGNLGLNDSQYARGLLGVVGNIMKNFPATYGANTGQTDRIKNEVIPILTRVYKRQIDDQIKMLRTSGVRGGPAGDLIGILQKIDPAMVASTQTEMFLKRSTLPESLQKMVSEMTNLNSNLSLDNMKQAFTEGIDNSQTMKKLTESYDRFNTILENVETTAESQKSKIENVLKVAKDELEAGKDSKAILKKAMEALKSLQSQGHSDATTAIKNFNETKDLASAIKELRDAGTSRGSLFTHDIHSEFYLKQMATSLNELNAGTAENRNQKLIDENNSPLARALGLAGRTPNGFFVFKNLPNLKGSDRDTHAFNAKV